MLAATGVVAVWHVVALALVLGCASAFDIPLRHAMIARLVEHRSELPNAIALNSLLINCARVVGPGARRRADRGGRRGGLLRPQRAVVRRRAHRAGADALARAPAGAAARGWLRSWLEGVRSRVRIRADSRGLLLIAAISGTIGTYSTLMPVFAKDVFGGGAHTLGILLSAAGSGALLSALYLASRRTTRGLRPRHPRCRRRRVAGDARLRAFDRASRWRCPC